MLKERVASREELAAAEMHSKAKIVYSLNLSGDLRDVEFAGQMVTTGYFKEPVERSVKARILGLDGDAQGDLKAHGGAEKAVCFYPREHYAVWERLLGTGSLPTGSFGENVTSEGFSESDLCIGDLLRVGSAVLQVRQPRHPCYKLQFKFQRSDMVALFVKEGLPGWYTSVVQEGSFTRGDEIVVVSRAPQGISVADIWRYSFGLESDSAMLDRIVELELLPSFWKERVARHRTNLRN
jgi:MOSC domain-containing protein YiiM